MGNARQWGHVRHKIWLSLLASWKKYDQKFEIYGHKWNGLVQIRNFVGNSILKVLMWSFVYESQGHWLWLLRSFRSDPIKRQKITKCEILLGVGWGELSFLDGANSPHYISTAPKIKYLQSQNDGHRRKEDERYFDVVIVVARFGRTFYNWVGTKVKKMKRLYHMNVKW